MPFNCKQKLGRAVVTSGGNSRIIGLTSVLVGILFFTMLHNPVQIFGAPLPNPYTLTLAWNPNLSPEVVGYHLYYGTASGNYTSSIVVGNVATATVLGLSVGVTYYFAITTVGADGQESDFSGEISYRQENSGTQMHIQGVSGGQFILTVTGPAEHTYDIEATQDFTTWTVIGTVTLDDSGSLDFTDTNAAEFPQRFYRTIDAQP
jgi:Fibronectin type III domain